MRTPAGIGIRLTIAIGGALAGLTGCANDPVYIPAPATIEGGLAGMNGKTVDGKASLTLPIKTETGDDAKSREALAAKLDPVTVPYVKIGDLEIEVEWTIQNLDDMDGQAQIQLNGANEYFSYDPSIIVLDPDDDEAPPTPGLAGDIPISVPKHAKVSGLFTEDQLREAAIDLDQITRGNVNPFRATLTISKNAQAFQPMTVPMAAADGELTQEPVGPEVPRAAFAEITRIDLVFKADRHMILEYDVRVRDLRGIMHDLLLAAVTEKPNELQMFMPMEYNPTPAPATP